MGLADANVHVGTVSGSLVIQTNAQGTLVSYEGEPLAFHLSAYERYTDGDLGWYMVNISLR